MLDSGKDPEPPGPCHSQGKWRQKLMFQGKGHGRRETLAVERVSLDPQQTRCKVDRWGCKTKRP